MTHPDQGPDRRSVLRWAAAGAGLSLLPASYAFGEAMSLEQRVGQMLLLGFIGSTVDTGGADQIAGHLASGRIGGVLFLRHNVRSREGVEGLTARFREIDPTAWMAVDQEGGLVQRLSRDLGYTAIPRALIVAQSDSVEQAKAVYSEAADEFVAAGFDLNLAPVADLNDPENAVIGVHGRSYGNDGETVAAYAAAFIEAYDEAGVVCAIKHFPGHGHSRGDSHAGFVDITDTWSEAELDPFRRLINAGEAQLIMGGHLTNRHLDPTGVPITFSAPVIEDLLRGQMGYTGAVMTDDLDMGAIHENYSQREAVLRSIEAGNDIIMLSNSAAPDPQLPQRVLGWVSEAITEGRLTEARIDQSVARIAALRAVSG
ncbi:glycoside hydrolase family 3 N-terminal domain-containing protein [uncultured Maricaulis sp.]|uniref:glycoside hydrolase family 3 protein n=1 Tax=uncultured Maricaulis sp. TaxID=174710 RepID=UPI0030DD85E6|tara:strand:+ start:1646 stop:2758 length:1113 start_codon:yes stop_codon:yes gene_type:complete